MNKTSTMSKETTKSSNGSKKEKHNSLHELYIAELKDAYSAENQIAKALPKLIEAVSNKDVKKGLQDHLEQTKNQAEKVAQICSHHNEKPTGEHCDGMEGLLKEGSKMLEEFESGPVLDAAIISASQKVEHYEIATYGTLRVFAETMGHSEDVKIISEIFDQEIAADKKLSKIAEKSVNECAMEEGKSSKSKK